MTTFLAEKSNAFLTPRTLPAQDSVSLVTGHAAAEQGKH